jgi:hypothetical protein
MIERRGTSMDTPGVAAARRWSRGKRAGVTVMLVVATLVAAALADLLFHLRPIAAEKFWIAGLTLGITPLQEKAIFELRTYPTRSAAVALVTYIRGKSRSGDLKLAGRATATLSALSGRSFGTPDAGQWPEVLDQIDQWAERALGVPR